MTDKIDDGGPAFPVHGGHADDDPRNRVLGGGMSLRDWFAGQALAGELAADDAGAPAGMRFPENAALHAARAYQLADAMLAARAKGGAQ